MKQLSLNCIFFTTLFSCTGCVSTSINDSVALIKREANLENAAKNKKVVNKSVLTSIQVLRSAQSKIEINALEASTQGDNRSYFFAYELHNKELNYDDKIKIVSLVVNKNYPVTIYIAPAKGESKIIQLALSMSRAEVLRLYINNFNNKVTINFDPKLSADTINLVTGA